MIRIVSTYVLVFITLLSVKGQQTGKWTEYLSTADGRIVTESESRVYCATGGGLYYLNKQDNSIEKLTRSNGLTDPGVDLIKYNEKYKVLFITYENSNIDLYFDETNEIFNISDIKRKDMLGDKSIYNITFKDEIAYLSCGFGIVAVNLERKEIKDTYIIGDEGAMLKVYNVACDDTWIYAATQEGIKRAEHATANLLDYHEWQKMTNYPRDNKVCKNIVFFNNEIVANYSTGSFSGEEFYAWDGAAWRRVLSDVSFAYGIEVQGDELLVAARGSSRTYNSDYSRTTYINKSAFADGEVGGVDPRSVIRGKDQLLWIADHKYGLVKTNGQEFEKVSPPGPADNDVFRLLANGDDLWVLKGGTNAGWNNSKIDAQFQLYRNGEWKKWDRTNVKEFNTILSTGNVRARDLINIAVDPNNPDHIVVSSWGNGLFEFKFDENEDQVTWYNKENSDLQNAIPNGDYTRCHGVDFDSEGNVYVAISETEHDLHIIPPQGDWTNVMLDITSDSDPFNGHLKILKDGNVWIQDRRSGFLVMNSKDISQHKEVTVEALFTNNEVRKVTNHDDVRSFAEDKDGALWVGTSKGVVVYHSPSRVFDQDEFYAYQPGLDLGDGLYHPLLESDIVSAIAVDGGNRKWCGTRSSGVFLISETGEKELQHFTTENSPLLSNEINDIAINPNSGEVFFATSEGLISYMGEATESANNYANVFVYPNPVRETYRGDVIIKGLKEDTDVKITDVAGNLVYETTSLGGQAVWDGKNSHGNRVSTGVYLVLGADKNREETFITKILFIH